MKKELNNHLKSAFADSKSDEKSVVRNFWITANGRVIGGGGVIDDSV